MRKYEEGTSFSSFTKRLVLIMAVIIFSCEFSGLSVPWQGDAERSRTPPHIHS